jgi:hypothetical protein
MNVGKHPLHSLILRKILVLKIVKERKSRVRDGKKEGLTMQKEWKKA